MVQFQRIVIDSLDFNLKVSGELINFESNFRNLSNKIKSKELKIYLNS